MGRIWITLERADDSAVWCDLELAEEMQVMELLDWLRSSACLGAVGADACLEAAGRGTLRPHATLRDAGVCHAELLSVRAGRAPQAADTGVAPRPGRRKLGPPVRLGLDGRPMPGTARR